MVFLLPLEHISTYFHTSGHILPPPHPPVYGILFCSPTYPIYPRPRTYWIFSDRYSSGPHYLLSLSLFLTCYKTFIARFEVPNLLTYSWYIQKWENSTIIKIFAKFRSKVLYFLPQLVILKKVSWDFKDLFQWYLPFAHFYLLPLRFPGGTSGKERKKERKKESEFAQSCPTLCGPHGL